MEEVRQMIELKPDADCSAALSDRLLEEARRLIAEVEASPDVKSAREAWQAAEDRQRQLQRAHSGLNDAAIRLSTEITAATDQLRDGLIERFSQQPPASDAGVGKTAERLASLRAQNAAVMSTIEHIAEHGHPRANIDFHQTQADFLYALAKGIETAAGERLMKTVTALQDVLAIEGGIEFNPGSMLSGNLLRRAQEIALEATRHKATAVELRQKYETFCKGEAARGPILKEKHVDQISNRRTQRRAVGRAPRPGGRCRRIAAREADTRIHQAWHDGGSGESRPR